MKFELDHFFIFTEAGAPIAERLVSLGLEEGKPNTHPGQGTSNRRFFFANSMLELIWVHDALEAASGPARRCLFLERSRESNASPFGLVFRRTGGVTPDVPFPGWKYEPDYLDPPFYFHVGKNSDNILEPLCIYMPFAAPPEKATDLKPFNIVSDVHITSPSEDPSDVLQQATKADGLTLAHGAQHLMEVTFCGGREHRSCDLSPALPFLLRW